jgi:riboflavin kinase/FMN adenylyltransferase
MTLHRLNWDEAPPGECRGGAVAVGNFDGVHLGHAALVRQLRERARPAVVVSFDPHPLLLLAPERFQPLLTTPEDRAELLRECGAEHVVLFRTTPELLKLSAEEFFTRILRDGFRPRAIVEGFNFRFGRDRGGDTDLLAALCRGAGIDFTLVPPLELDGAPVSSSRVRSALLAGDVTEAARLMGRTYRIRGVVGTGQKRGRTLGFPTANLEQVPTLLPGDGVYAVRVTHDDKTFAGAANVGPNPTFGEHARKLEVHMIDFAGDLYGETLGIAFLRRLRGTRPFAGPDDLVKQLRQDVEEARRVSA